MEEIALKVEEAQQRLHAHVLKTPLMFSQFLSDLGKAEVYLKLGRFKIHVYVVFLNRQSRSFLVVHVVRPE